MKFHISKEQILKQVQSAFEKKEVLCRQIFDTVYTHIDTKKKSFNKAKTFIKDNHQGMQDYFFSLIKDKDVVNKVQNTLKKNPIVKNVIERGDKYIGHYIKILNKPQNDVGDTPYKTSSQKTPSSKQAHSVSRLKPSSKKKVRKSTSEKTKLTKK